MTASVRLCSLPCLLLLCLSSAHATEGYYYGIQFGNAGGASVELAWPEGADIHGSEIFVADRMDHRVMVYSLNGVYARNYLPDYAFMPSGIDVDSAGTVYVTDGNQGQWHKVSNDLGTVHGVFSADGDDANDLYGPGGICVDEARNRVYIADTNHHRISVWRRNGDFATTFGSFGTGNDQFKLPRDVAIDSLGRIYVTDSGNDRVKRFSVGYVYQNQFSGVGTPAGSMGLSGIMIDGNDRVYVSSTTNSRVYKYTVNGTLLCWLGAPGTGNGQFDDPWGLAMDGSGRLYVVDCDNDRVQRFGHNTYPTTPLSVTITPASPRDNNMLRATASGSTDADGDPLSYRYRWYSSPDNAVWTFRANTASVSSTMTVAGEYWKAQARAYDGHHYSNWKSSAVVHILPAAGVPALVATASQTGAGIGVTVTLAGAAEVSGQLCNVAGRMVAAVPVRALSSGTSSFVIAAQSGAGTRLPAGRYLLKLTAAEESGSMFSQVVPFNLR